MVTIVGTVGCVSMVFRSLCQFQQMDMIHIMGGRHVWPMFTPRRTGTVTGTFVYIVNQTGVVRSGRKATVRARFSMFVRRSEFISWKSGTIRVHVKTFLRSVRLRDLGSGKIIVHVNNCIKRVKI